MNFSFILTQSMTLSSLWSPSPWWSPAMMMFRLPESPMEGRGGAAFAAVGVFPRFPILCLILSQCCHYWSYLFLHNLSSLYILLLCKCSFQDCTTSSFRLDLNHLYVLQMRVARIIISINILIWSSLYLPVGGRASWWSLEALQVIPFNII